MNTGVRHVTKKYKKPPRYHRRDLFSIPVNRPRAVVILAPEGVSLGAVYTPPRTGETWTLTAQAA